MRNTAKDLNVFGTCYTQPAPGGSTSVVVTMESKIYAVACTSCLHALLMRASYIYVVVHFVPYEDCTHDD